ncbi:MAG: DUF86 domain-containing protein [Pseudomonadota bacterium]|nr:DUF86 domain-containing protein [Pseudomonadota bacterium]
MTDDVVVNKCAIIDRCLARIREEYVGHEDELATNFTRQDSIVLNLQRACETSIDLANRLVRLNGLMIPQTSAESFALLTDAGLLSPELAKSLQGMVGFRNVAVHDYRRLNLDIVRHIVETRLSDFERFEAEALSSE